MFHIEECYFKHIYSCAADGGAEKDCGDFGRVGRGD